MRTLLQDIDDFLLVHPEITPAALGRAALRDTYFVNGLRRGRSPRESTVARVRAWMASYTRDAREREAATRGARKRIEEMARQVQAQRPAAVSADAVT